MREGTGLTVNESVEGEMIEQKVERAVHDGEPIKDGAPKIFTDRKDGVLPEYNIRTDRFAIAIDAMDKTAKSYKARRENKADVKPDMKVEKGGKAGDEGAKAEGGA